MEDGDPMTEMCPNTKEAEFIKNMTENTQIVNPMNGHKHEFMYYIFLLHYKPVTV